MQQIRRKTVKARTDHQCDLCLERIYKDQSYASEAIVSGAVIWTFRMCLICDKVVELFKTVGSDGSLDSEIFKEIVEGLCEERGIATEGKRTQALCMDLLSFCYSPGKVYISGPMTGKPSLNGKAFYAAERELIATGVQVVNPQRISEVVNRKHAEVGTVPAYGDYMRADLLALLSECSVIYMLEGWEESRGACMEHAVAEICGMDVIFQKRACK